MLPTTGFFKNIDCPYYENSCERPYCHFKHRKKSQETGEPSTASVPPEIPTYNPTPKSQLANSRSHIPISYVPDLAIRTERNNLRSVSSYGYGDKPTYNPTPLSILSTGKVNSSKSSEENKSADLYKYSRPSYGESNLNNDIAKYSPTYAPEDSNDVNFEDLETEFDMIDEIISDSGAADTANGESESTTEDEKYSQKANLKSNESSKSKNHSKNSDKPKDDKKHNGKVSESSSSKSKSDSKSKSRSHSSKKESSKTETRHKKDSKSSKSSRESREEKRKSSKSDDKKKESKEKRYESKEKHSSSKHKENSSEKDKHDKHKSKLKERDKEKRSSEKKKHKEKESSDRKEANKTKNNEKLTNEMLKQPSNNDIVKLYTSEDFNDCDMPNDYDNYVDEEDSDLEEDTLEECYKIFTEYKPTEPDIFAGITNTDRQESFNEEENVNVNLTLHGKKRVAHENASKTQPKVMFSKPKSAPNAAQAMINRLKAARAAHANNEQNNIINEMNRHILKRSSEMQPNDNKKIQKTSTSTAVSLENRTRAKPSTSSTSSSLIDDIISGKSSSSNAKPRRIAPVQNVNSIQRAKAKIEEMAKMRAVNAIVKSAPHSVTKGSKRVAHIPEASAVDIPDVLEAERSKLPVNVRSRFLKMIIDECVKLYLSTDDAYQRALGEEFKCYERCSALVTYRNSAMLAISRLRKELQEREMSGLGPILPGESSTTSKDDKCELRGRKFYENIKRYILNEEELVLHGFPREGTIPGRAVVKTQKKVSKGYLDEDDRLCCRCKKLYKVDRDGFALYNEECLYHPLKKRTFRGESIYLCCKSSEDTGCVTSTTHVSETLNLNDAEIEGYQTTMPPEYDEDPRSYEVFALDCEMCYTTKGLELTRVTIVNSECKTVYESLVKPLNSIIDYNTRFSGITEEQMNRTATSILQVQANILHLCNSNTILIGHSLESDMKALKIIHNTIIDTSVLFPHKFGLPHKRALRDLAREFLKKIIQNDISGHDSAEDALTCMELVQWKLKEEFKARGVKV